VLAAHRAHAVLLIAAASALFTPSCRDGPNSGGPVVCSDAMPNSIDGVPGCPGAEPCTPCDWCSYCGGSETFAVIQCSPDGTWPYQSVLDVECGLSSSSGGGQVGQVLNDSGSSSGGVGPCVRVGDAVAAPVWSPSVEPDGSETCPYGPVDQDGCCDPCPGFVIFPGFSSSPSGSGTCPDGYALNLGPLLSTYQQFCCPSPGSGSDAGLDAADSTDSLDSPGKGGSDSRADAP
jgi:hypothetical protein